MTSSTLDMAQLYDAEKGRLRAFVRRLVRNPATAEDLVQQAFANMLESGPGIQTGSAYVRRAARNLAFNHLRDARRRGEVEMAGMLVEELADNRPSPEMEVLHRSELRRLLQAVALLPERRRQAFALNRIDGLSYDEIAVRMGISRNTVISHVVAALAELDRRLT